MGFKSAHGEGDLPRRWGVWLRKFSAGLPLFSLFSGCYIFTVLNSRLLFSHDQPPQQLPRPVVTNSSVPAWNLMTERKSKQSSRGSRIYHARRVV